MARRHEQAYPAIAEDYANYRAFIRTQLIGRLYEPL
jgi:hypothetical protein